MAFSANIFGPNTGVSMASRREGATDRIADKGRRGDQYLVHASPFTRSLLKAMGGAGTVNPKTGLMEFYSIGLGDMGGVNPVAMSDSDAINTLSEAGYIADDDYISGLDNIDDGVDLGGFVGGLYESIGRSGTIDKQGADYWTNQAQSYMDQGQTYQEAMGNVAANFVNSASLVDEQRDTLVSNLNDGTYDQFFTDIGRDKSDFLGLANDAISEYGMIDDLASKYAGEISANNLTQDQYSLGDVGQRIIDSGDESVIAGDKIGFAGDLVGQNSNELQTMFEAAEKNEFEIRGLEGTQAQLRSGVDSIAQSNPAVAEAAVSAFNNLSEGEQLQIQSNIAKGGDAAQLLLNTALLENNGEIGGNSFSNVAMGDTTATDVLGDNVLTGDSTEQEIFDTFVNSGVIDDATANEIVNNGLSDDQVEQITEAFDSATGGSVDTTGMSVADIIAELQNIYNMSNYNPLAFLNAFGFALDPTYLGQIIPTLSTGLTGAYTVRRVRDRETGEYRNIRVPISPEAINATARNQRRAGFGSVISV